MTAFDRALSRDAPASDSPIQQLLPLSPRCGEEGAPVLGAANAEARSALAALASGRGGGVAIVGPEASGKTALLSMEPRIGLISPETLASEAIAVSALERGRPAYAVDGLGSVDSWCGEAGAARARGLFHLLNRSAELGVGVALLSRAAPARWPTPLKDLGSRLATLPVARIDAPDDALLDQLLETLFARRGVRVAAPVRRYLLARMPRDYAAVGRLVETLDAASLRAQRPVTPRLAAEALGWGGGAW